jgi:hypothetical protein
MEEAEALSTKMGIMIRGGIFKCYGSSQHIKSKFGTGYELEIKIMKQTFAELIELRKLIKVHEPGWVNELITNYEKLKETMTATSNSLTKSYARNIELESAIAVLQSNNKEISTSLTVSRNRNSVLSVSNNILTKDNSNLLETNTELKTKNENLTKSYAIELSKLQDSNIEIANEQLIQDKEKELESVKSQNNEISLAFKELNSQRFFQKFDVFGYSGLCNKKFGSSFSKTLIFADRIKNL